MSQPTTESYTEWRVCGSRPSHVWEGPWRRSKPDAWEISDLQRRNVDVWLESRAVTTTTHPVVRHEVPRP